jgi:hypothetical protein
MIGEEGRGIGHHEEIIPESGVGPHGYRVLSGSAKNFVHRRPAANGTDLKSGGDE